MKDNKLYFPITKICNNFKNIIKNYKTHLNYINRYNSRMNIQALITLIFYKKEVKVQANQSLPLKIGRNRIQGYSFSNKEIQMIV